MARELTTEVKCENLISWIWDHAYNLEEFIRALKWCGFTEDEVVKMSEDEGWDTLGVRTIFWED